MAKERSELAKKLLPTVSGMTDLERMTLGTLFLDINTGGFSYGDPGAIHQEHVVIGNEDAEFNVHERTSVQSGNHAAIHAEDFYRKDKEKRKVAFTYDGERRSGEVKYTVNEHIGDTEGGHEVTRETELPQEDREPFLREVLLATPLIPDTAYHWYYLNANKIDPKPIQWINPLNEGYVFDIVEFNAMLQERKASQQESTTQSSQPQI